MTEFRLDERVPPHVRPFVAKGGAPLYVLNRPDLDRVPIDTFLVETVMGTEGNVAQRVMRVVKPHKPAHYPLKKLTNQNRLIYVCWQEGFAVRRLADARRMSLRHVVLPDDPRHQMVDAFKIACDTKRALAGDRVPFSPALLCRALGLPPEWQTTRAG